MSDPQYVISGVVHYIGETVTRGKDFQVRTLVIETTDPKYPQLIPIEFTGKNIDKPDAVSVGDEVSCTVNIRGREWTGKSPRQFFVSLSGWKLETTRAVDRPQQRSTGGPAQQTAPTGGPDEDIPFAHCTGDDRNLPAMWTALP